MRPLQSAHPPQPSQMEVRAIIIRHGTLTAELLGGAVRRLIRREIMPSNAICAIMIRW
jgi:transcriptional regulatory protein LevR